MDIKEADRQLLDLLIRIEFDLRYYQFVESVRGASEPALTKKELQVGIDRMPFDFKYDAKEKFFYFRDRGPLEIGLNLSLTPLSAEFILVLRASAGHVGDSYPGMAYDVHRARTLNSDNVREPPYPPLRFNTPEEYANALDFGVGLYNDIKQEARKLNW